MVEWFKRPKRKIPNRALSLHAAAGSVLAGLAFVSPASAQYSFSPGNADELGGGMKVFGSAKDDNGALLPDVTVKIANLSVQITDVQGRYRAAIDSVLTAQALTVGCTKPGYQFLRVMKRPGPVGAAKPMVEADCVLHKAQ